MSGFAGFVGRGSEEDRRAVLSAMGARLARGGEPTESYLDDDIALVCRRSSNGRGPIRGSGLNPLVVMEGASDADRSKILGFAGAPAEIEIGLEDLEGAFALLVWSPNRQRLLMARDRVGKRPLYYYQGPELLVFASELKLLLGHPDCPREMEWKGGADVMDSRATFFRQLHALPGGEYAIWNRGEPLRIASYATRAVAEESAEGEGELVGGLLRLLTDSVGYITLDSGVIAISAEHGAASALVLSALAKAGGPALDSLWILDPKGRGPRLAAWMNLPQSLGLHACIHTADDLEVLEQLDFSLQALECLVQAADEPFLDLKTIARAASYVRLQSASPGIPVLSAMDGVHLFPAGSSFSTHVTEAALAHAGMPKSFRPFMRPAFRPGWEWSALADRQSEWVIRSCELQRRLPLEERIADELGTRVEAPFLDRRLLALAQRAASADRGSPRGLLWDTAERALSPAALRVLEPFEGGAEEEGAAFTLGRRILDGVLPAFLDTYCGHSDSMFSADRMGQVFEAARRARPGSVVGARLIAGLLEGVTAAIFARHVARG